MSNMNLTNDKIYSYAQNLMEAFKDGEQQLPIKINFYIQKNKATLTALAQDIEKIRLGIAEHYGELNEDGSQYIIPDDKMEAASKELKDLFELTQDVNIYTLNVDSLSDDLTLTTAQMDAIMFMIE